MTDAIRRPSDFDQMMDDLVLENRLFQTFKDLMVFAAILGYEKGIYNDCDDYKSIKDPIRLAVFRGEFDAPIINAIALAHTRDPEMLSNEKADERHKIFECYAYGGLNLIRNQIYECPDREQAMIDLVVSFLQPKERSVTEIFEAY